MNQPLPQRPAQVTSTVVMLGHNTCAQLVAFYGELLAEQEKKMQALAAQVGGAQQQLAMLAESLKAKDAEIAALKGLVSSER